jgi:hypothetical protein
MVLGAILAGTLAGVCGHVAGLETGREQGITIGESRANMACDKAHYEVCKLVRTFTQDLALCRVLLVSGRHQ